jgi:hypothetical protein
MSDDPRNPGSSSSDTPSTAQTTGASPHLGAFDPRRAVDPSTIERMIHAQVVARTQAQAATTVVLATIVSLITSAFSFVAALAWNTAIQQLLKENVKVNKGAGIFGITISEGGVQAIYAAIVTVIAVVVVLLLNRIAKRYANKSAFGNGGK